MYVTFDYYTNEYKGSTIKSDEFEHLELKSRAVIDSLTFGNIKVVDNNIKNCVCEIMEATKLESERAGIKSESNGALSVTYLDNHIVNTLAKPIITKWLSNTDLLYRGL